MARAKNESDIIESFIRYNLSYSDGIIIWERGSTDNTKEIIQKLVAEGLPIYLEDEPAIVAAPFINGEDDIRDIMAQVAINEHDADIILPLDADEFLYHVDGSSPCETLECLPEHIEHQVQWRTYLYEKEPDRSMGFLPNNFNKYRNPKMENETVSGTTIVSRWLIDNKQVHINPGAHDLSWMHHQEREMEISTSLVCAHFPIRSRMQALQKRRSTLDLCLACSC